MLVNLRSGYDLVMHAAAAMSMQWQGALDPPMVSMFSTLQGMEHSVRTAFGDSQWMFGGCGAAVRGNMPPQGFGQGNGVAPGGWVVISSPILEELQQTGHGASLPLAVSGLTVHLVGGVSLMILTWWRPQPVMTHSVWQWLPELSWA